GVSRGRPSLNPDYIPALELLLTRAGRLGARLDDAWVDSKRMRDVDLADRRLQLEGMSFPILLASIGDMKEFRLRIRRSVSRIGRTRESSGTGNRRIRLALSLARPMMIADFQNALVGSPGSARLATLRSIRRLLRTGVATEANVDMSLQKLGEVLIDGSLPASRLGLLDSEVRRKAWKLTRHAAPIVRHRLSRYVERGQIGKMVKAANNYRCQICNALGLNGLGFLTLDGTPYVEAHHVMQVSTLGDDVLGPRNVITVCPNHHRQLHFGSATSSDLGDAFEFELPPHPPFRIHKFTGGT
ncbi:MAG: HNH endonuclease, partial [Thermomicrobiales bacterium]